GSSAFGSSAFGSSAFGASGVGVGDSFTGSSFGGCGACCCIKKYPATTTSTTRAIIQFRFKTNHLLRFLCSTVRFHCFSEVILLRRALSLKYFRLFWGSSRKKFSVETISVLELL